MGKGMQHKTNIKKLFKRYYVSKPVMGLMIGVDVLSMVLYLVLLFCIPYSKHTPLWEVCVNFFLVLFSVFSSALLSVLLIETKSKNDMFREIMCTEVLSSPELYECLSEDKQRSMLNGLECSLLFNNCEQKQSMYNSVRRKIEGFQTDDAGSSQQGYYFEKCQYDIKCSIKNGYIEKDIIKIIDVRSYRPQTIESYVLCENSGEWVAGLKPMEIVCLKVGAKEYNENDLQPENALVTYDNESVQNEVYNEKSGYSKRIIVKYNRPLNISPDKETLIEMRNITRVPINDIAFTCRLKFPCHKFSFSYRIIGENASNYRLNARAFGFAESGKSAPNRHDDEPEISISFDNWVFPHDGVAVTMLEKDNQHMLDKRSEGAKIESKEVVVSW